MDIKDYENLVERIAYQVTGINTAKLTGSENQVCHLLDRAGFIELTENEFGEYYYRMSNPRKPFQGMPVNH